MKHCFRRGGGKGEGGGRGKCGRVLGGGRHQALVIHIWAQIGPNLGSNSPLPT